MSPQVFYSGIIPPSKFSGREVVVKRICERIKQPERPCTAIVGGPRTGHTSLMKYLASPEAAGKYSELVQFLPIYIPAEVIGSEAKPVRFWEYFFNEVQVQGISDELLTAVSEILTKINAGMAIHNLQFFIQDFFDACAAGDTPVLIIIHQLDDLLRSSHKSLWNDFFNYLRFLAERVHKGKKGISMVVGTSRPILSLWDASSGPSPWYNIFTDQLSIGRLEEDEARNLIHQGFAETGVDLEKNVEDLIIQISELHPFLVNHLGSICLEMVKEEGQVDVDEIMTEITRDDGVVNQLVFLMQGCLNSTENQWLNQLYENPESLTHTQRNQLKSLWRYGLIPPGTKIL